MIVRVVVRVAEIRSVNDRNSGFRVFAGNAIIRVIRIRWRVFLMGGYYSTNIDFTRSDVYCDKGPPKPENNPRTPGGWGGSSGKPGTLGERLAVVPASLSCGASRV